MRYAIVISMVLTSLSAVAQQDIHLNRLTVLGGPTRYIGEIEQPWDAFDHEHSAFAGLAYQRFLGYGTSLYTQFSLARLQGNDLKGGSISRALNFRSELNTLELGFRTYLDNGSWLNYDARFAPFLSIGAGAGTYVVRVDQFDASGQRYNYWRDGTVRDLPEGSPNAAQAVITGQDGKYETNVTALATEDDKPNDAYFFYIPAQLGLKFRVSQYFSLELAYGFNWTFTDHLDDISGDYAAVTEDLDLNYLSNPTNMRGSRGDAATNDHYHTLSLGLAYSFGKRSKRYRMTPIYVDGVEPAPPDTIAKPKVPAPPVQKKKSTSTSTMDTLRVRTLIIERIVVDTIEVRSSLVLDADARLQPKPKAALSDSSSVISNTTSPATVDSSRYKAIPANTPTLPPDSTAIPAQQNSAEPRTSSQLQNDSTALPITPASTSPITTPADTTAPAPKVSTPPKQQDAQEPDAPKTPEIKEQPEKESRTKTTVVPVPVIVPTGNKNETRALEDSLANARTAQKRAEAELERLRKETIPPSPTTPVVSPKADERTRVVPVPVPVPSSKPDTVKQTTTSAVPNDQAIRQAQRKRLNSLMLERIGMIEGYLAMQATLAPDSVQRKTEQQVQLLDVRIIALRDSINASALLGKVDETILKDPNAAKEDIALVDTLYFATGSSSVQERFKAGLNEQATHFLRSGKGKVLVTGHSDGSGPADFNLTLSEARAEAVAQLLREAGVPESSMVVKGLGELLARALYSEKERNVVVQMIVHE